MEQNPSDDSSFPSSLEFPVFHKTQIFLTYLLRRTSSPWAGSSVGIATVYGLDGPGIESNIFHTTIVFVY